MVRGVGVVVLCVVLVLGVGVCGASASERVFGFESFAGSLGERDGAPARQAGSHPYAFTTTFVFNHRIVTEGTHFSLFGEVLPEEVETFGELKDVEVNLPRGVVVDPQATPTRCTKAELVLYQACPVSSVVGYMLAFAAEDPPVVPAAIYNMVPPNDVPAEFGSNIAGLGIEVFINGSVRSGSDYGLSAGVREVLRTHRIYSVQTTIWGDPSDPSHNAQRGKCAESFPALKAQERSKWLAAGSPLPIPENPEYDRFDCPPEPDETPTLSMPGSCSGQPLLTSIAVTSWQKGEIAAQAGSPAPSGCESLQFAPKISVKPETTAPSSPSGLSFDLRVPQNETLGNQAEANLRKAVVALPAGMTLNPSTANGREACSPEQIGLQPRSTQRQAITIERPLADAFTLQYEENGVTQHTPPIHADASAAELQAVLEALPDVGAGNVEVRALTGGWEITFQGPLAQNENPLLHGETLDNAFQEVALTATGGTFKLALEGEETASLNYYENDEKLQQALEALPDVGAGNVRVTGGPEYTGNDSQVYQVTFTGTLAGKPVQTLTATSALEGENPEIDVTNHSPNTTPLGVTIVEPGDAVRLGGKEPKCPKASEIGTVEVKTPLLAHPLPGLVYLASQDENPFNSTFAIYIVIEDPETGILVKLAGKVEANPETGQLTTTFEENPQLPFGELVLHLWGGERAPLATPATCGPYTTTSQLTPWSTPTPTTTASPPFEVEPCTTPAFAPAFSAGTIDNQAGAYSPLVLTLSRDTQEQQLDTLEATLPPGVLAKLAGVPECPNTNAQAGTCPENSQIGIITVTAGIGNDPVRVEGKIYLTGPYDNGPFGEVAVVPAVAGPFDLGNVIVRGSIRVNPTTAQPTIVSDPLPQYVTNTGVPADTQQIDVTINRNDFTLNPTNCTLLTATETTTSTTHTTANTTSPFEAANCATLPFKPTLQATVTGKASKANGTNLNVRYTAKDGPQPGGGETNTRSVKVELPKQLPSRLATLQKACLATTFETNPAACPPQSDIGTWTATTPLLTQPLTGPAYLVSYGAAKFPDLVTILQGENITITVTGTIDVKHGITSIDLETLPDTPITTVEQTYPAGPYSALATNIPEHDHYNLCNQNLQMPTQITAQNGATTKQTTHITTTNCPKPKPKHTTKHKKG